MQPHHKHQTAVTVTANQWLINICKLMTNPYTYLFSLLFILSSTFFTYIFFYAFFAFNVTVELNLDPKLFTMQKQELYYYAVLALKYCALFGVGTAVILYALGGSCYFFFHNLMKKQLSNKEKR